MIAVRYSEKISVHLDPSSRMPSLLDRHRYWLASAAACLAYASFTAGLGMTPVALLLLGTSFLTADSAVDAERSAADESRASRRSSRGAAPGRGDDGPRDGRMGNNGHDDEPDQSAGMSLVPSTSSLSDMAAAAALADLAEEVAGAVAQPAREAAAGAQLRQPGQDRAAQAPDPPVASPAVERRRATGRVRRAVVGRHCPGACGAYPRSDPAALAQLALFRRLRPAAVAL
jgi:hypothetical protein